MSTTTSTAKPRATLKSVQAENAALRLELATLRELRVRDQALIASLRTEPATPVVETPPVVQPSDGCPPWVTEEVNEATVVARPAAPVRAARPARPAGAVVTRYTDRAGRVWEKVRVGNMATSRLITA